MNLYEQYMKNLQLIEAVNVEEDGEELFTERLDHYFVGNNDALDRFMKDLELAVEELMEKHGIEKE